MAAIRATDVGIASLGYPPEYTPLPPQAGLASRLMALFSPFERCRVNFANASRETTPDQVDRLIRSVERLTASPRRLSEETILGDSVAFIVWSLIGFQDLSRAGLWIRKLSETAPQRISLSWQLFTACADSADIPGAVLAASAFLAEPQHRATMFRPAIGKAADYIFANIERSSFSSTLKRIAPSLHSESWHKAITALISYPSEIETAEQAMRFLKGVRPEALEALPHAHCAALVSTATALEILKQDEEMWRVAQLAMKILPNDADARYWSARACLRTGRPVPSATTTSLSDTMPASPRRQRMAAMESAAAMPTGLAARSLFNVSVSKASPPVGLERELIRSLLDNALRVSPSASLDELRVASEVARLVESEFEQSTVTQRALALREMILDHTFDLAYRRLEAIVQPEAEILDLIAVGRIFAGSPRFLSKPSNAIEQLESSVYRVLTPLADNRTEHIPSDDELRSQALNAAFPNLANVRSLVESAYLQSPGMDSFEQSDTPWMQVLRTQLSLQTLESSGQLRSESMSIQSAAQAWFIEAWWFLYAAPLVQQPDCVANSSRLLDQFTTTSPAQIADSMSNLRSQRLARDGRPTAKTGVFSIPDWALGEAGQRSLHEAFEFEREFLAELANKRVQADEALSAWTKLKLKLERLTPGTKAIWSPKVHFHLASAQTAIDLDLGQHSLEQLSKSAVGEQARIQIGIARIALGEYEEAEAHLSGVSEAWPAFQYAKAVLAERKHDSESALAHLSTLQKMPASVYRAAADRLKLAIEERRDPGNLRIGEPIPRPSRLDRGAAIEAIRFLRRWCRRSYSNSGKNGSSEELRCAARLSEQLGGSYALSIVVFSRLLVDPQAIRRKELEEIPDPEIRRAAANILVRSFLASREFSEAQSMAAELLPYSETARRLSFFGELYMALSTLCSGASLPFDLEGRTLNWLDTAMTISPASVAIDRLVSATKKAPATASESDQKLIAKWIGLCRQALSICDPKYGVPPAGDRLGEIDPLMDIASRLLSDVKNVRFAAGSEAAERMERDLRGLDSKRKSVLTLLSSWARSDDETYLATYVEAVSGSGTFPIAPDSAWLAAGKLWFERKNWHVLLEADLPKEIESLQDPRVRWTIGMAYAHSAADDCAKSDLQSARAKIRQARSTLESLHDSNQQVNKNAT